MKKLALLLILFSSSALAAVRGTVMTVNGAPIAGAEVSAFTRESSEAREERLRSENPQRTAIATATTDATGNFSLDVKKTPAVDVDIDAAGYEPLMLLAGPDDDLGGIIARAVKQVSGTVTAVGKPVGNARLTFTAWRAAIAEFITTTDAEGRYTAPDPSVWATGVTVSHPDFAQLVERPRNRQLPLNLQLVPGTKLTGRVVGEDAKTPVSGARVSAGGQRATTAEDGTFTIAHAPSPPPAIRVSDATRSVTLSPGASSAAIRLAKVGNIFGVVRDAKTQRPLAGARVALSLEFGSDSDWVISDAKGTFALRNVPAGRYRILTSFPNYTFVPGEADLRPGQTVEKNVAGSENAVIAGRVTDESKKAVPAVRVVAVPREASQMPPMMFMNRAQTPAHSTPDGRFVLRNVESDQQVEVTALRRGMPPGTAGPFKLASGEVKTGVAIVLPRGNAVTGTVVDRNGRPVAGVKVFAIATEDQGAMMMRRFIMRSGDDPADNVETQADGTFTIQLKEGRYDVTFRREGFAPRTLRAYAVTNDPAPIEVTLDPGVEIRGRVIRRDGSGVPDVMINPFMADRGGELEPIRTDANGGFVITSLRPGPVSFIAMKPEEMIREMRNVNAPADDVVIEIPPGTRIEGRVVEKASKQPVLQFRAGITNELSGGGMMFRGQSMMKSFATDDGTFVLDNVPPGRADLVVEAPGFVTKRITGLTLEEAKPLKEMQVELEPGVRLFGRVTGPDGAPLSGVSVQITDTDRGFAGGGGLPRASTDGAGEYSIDSLEAGEKTFVFARDGFASERKTVRLSGKETRLDARLERGKEVTGSVINEAGVPIAEATVSARSGVQDAGWKTTRTDANGAFRFEGLTPGRYTFRASKAGYVAGEIKDIDLDAATAGVRLTLSGGGTIYGRVIGLSEHELPTTTVNAVGSAARQSGPVDASGNFRVEGVPTGTVRVTAITRSGAMAMKESAAQTVEVTAGSAVQVDLEFKSDVVIRGRVSRDGQPIRGGFVMFTARDPRIQTRANVTTDANGVYEASGLSPGQYTVRVSDMGRPAAFETEYEVTGSANFDIEIRGSDIRGRVVDANTGEPIAGATVMLQKADGTPFFGSRPIETDQAGRFSFETVAPGAYRARAQKERYGQAIADVSVGEGDSREIDLKLTRTEGLRLFVFDARDGRRLGATVWVRDQQGRFAFEGSPAANSEGVILVPLAPGRYKANISVPGYATRTMSVVVPSQDIHVALTPGGTLVIQSKRSARELAYLMTPSGDRFERGPWSRPQMVIDPGVTSMENLAPGPYVLQLLDDRGNVKDSYSITVGEGQVTRVEI